MTINLLRIIVIESIIHWFNGEDPSFAQILQNTRKLFKIVALYSFFISFLKFLTGGVNKPKNKKYSLKSLPRILVLPLSFIINLFLEKTWKRLDFYTLVNLITHKSLKIGLKEFILKTAVIKWHGMIDLIDKKETRNTIMLIFNSIFMVFILFFVVFDQLFSGLFELIMSQGNFLELSLIFSLFMVIPIIIASSLIFHLNSSFIFIYTSGIIRRESRPSQFPPSLDEYLNLNFPGLFNYRQFRSTVREMKNPYEDLNINPEMLS